MSFAVQPRQHGALQPGDVLVVIHDFDARSSDELTLRKTDQIELVELDEGFGDGWYLGRHLSHGNTGLFPGVYTAKLPPNFRPVGMGMPSPKSYAPAPSPPVDASNDQRTIAPVPAEIAQSRATPPTSSSNRMSAGPAPSPPSAYNPNVQRSIGHTLSGAQPGEESPVMNETLSVIEEHITDLNTPRQSMVPMPRPVKEDSESDYSSHLDRVSSSLAGPETDSDDAQPLTETEVKQWSAKETADFLRNLGVDAKHCDIFEEQDISGDVLLDMDQSFIHMKEYDFGLMGRRLKTWHKIRDFQAHVRTGARSDKSTPQPSEMNEETARTPSRGLAAPTILPRIPSLREERGLSIRPPQQPRVGSQGGPASPSIDQYTPPPTLSRPSLSASTPPASPWRASMAGDSPNRPSAASIREMTHSRRHSSMDFAKPGHQDYHGGMNMGTPLSPPHKKKTSLDRDWSMSNATTANTGGSTPSLKLNHAKTQGSLDLSAESPYDGDPSTVDIDRGYFSGNEVNVRRSRVLLKRRDELEKTGHSRQSSAVEDSRKSSAGVKRHSRLSSVDSIKDRAPPPISPAAKAYHSRSYKGRFRSSSARNLTGTPSPTAPSPTVTNLEDDGPATLPSPKPVSGSTSPAAAAHLPWVSSQKARKLLGLRAASEAVTGSEKEAASSSNITTETLRESPSASPSGSQTPSATSRSFEIDNTDTSSKGTTEQLGPLLHTKQAIRTAPKSKRQTSAYTRGLLQMTPAEARVHCDYHGWMKKRSAGLVPQWRPRLFILRGRRLSYYYSETDTEEKGVIDISGHKVLSASADPLTTLQATIQGTSSTPVGPSLGPSAAKSPDAVKMPAGSTPFFFKLVPPKVGLSRAVQFTKPTVHFFQVDSIAQGRKWMGEILKATIEHDLSSFETTNRQKTVSLAKARARKERPPALRGTETVTEAAEKPSPPEETTQTENGLNIQGLEFNESDIDLQLGTRALGLPTTHEDKSEARPKS